MELPTVRLVDRLLAAARRLLNVDLVRRLDRLGVIGGGYALYGLIGLMAITFLIAGIRLGEVALIVGAVVVIPGGIILHYMAMKMLDPIERLISTSRTELTSAGYLDVIALLNLIIAVLVPPVALVSAIAGGILAPVYLSIVAFVFGVFATAIALNPAVVNVHPGRSSSVGQEAIGLITFGIKSFYRFVPLGFATGVVLAALMTLSLLVTALTGDATTLSDAVFLQGPMIVTLTLGAALLPLLGYLGFVSVYLLIDLYRSIFLMAQVASQYRRRDDPPPPPRAP